MKRKQLEPIPFECEPLINIAEAAKILNCDRRTVDRMAKEKYIPAMRLGVGQRKRWRFRASVLDDWLRKQMGTAD